MDKSMRHKIGQPLILHTTEEGWIEVGLSTAKVEKCVQTENSDLHKFCQTEHLSATQVELSDKPVQTDTSNPHIVDLQDKSVQTGEVLEEDHLRPRPLDQCVAMYKEKVNFI